MNVHTGQVVSPAEFKVLRQQPDFDPSAWAGIQADREVVDELSRKVKLAASQIGNRKIRRQAQRNRKR